MYTNRDVLYVYEYVCVYSAHKYKLQYDSPTFSQYPKIPLQLEAFPLIQ